MLDDAPDYKLGRAVIDGERVLIERAKLTHEETGGVSFVWFYAMADEHWNKINKWSWILCEEQDLLENGYKRFVAGIISDEEATCHGRVYGLER